jgi:hypothetical protein
MNEARKLRELAAWYRASAERAAVAWIWEARLLRAEALEDEAERLDRIATQSGSEDSAHPIQRR